MRPAYLAMFKEMGISWGSKSLRKIFAGLVSGLSLGGAAAEPPLARCGRAWQRALCKAIGPKLIAGARRVLARLGRAHPLGLVTAAIATVGGRDANREFVCHLHFAGARSLTYTAAEGSQPLLPHGQAAESRFFGFRCMRACIVVQNRKRQAVIERRTSRFANRPW